MCKLADGDYVYPVDLIIVADTYDKNQQAGYIVERIGNQFSTNEKVVFDGEMFVCVTDHLGNTTERFKAIPRSDTAYGFIADIPDIQINIYDGMNIQSPSRYVISISLKWTQ